MNFKLYLLPTVLAPETQYKTLSPEVIEKIKELNIFFVENLKTARRFISSLKLGKVIDEITFYELTKNSNFDETFEIISQLPEDAGILSEAGCPGIADPGALAVDIAHQLDIEVIPLVGPSSILLALMASGFNGQSFAFHGYLPIDKKERARRVKELERLALTSGQTQLFMETPYRNNQMLDTIVKTCNPNTKLSISANLTGEGAISKTMRIEKWKQAKNIDLHKKPAIFGFGS
ncbi:SAM-dependent methyltransferase [Jiulongibacter sediminis]|uniref:SAM-dependent methyltransferase n=1 Tax=Jiulongibacter sediminis TaxID=1605367 RepID=A0A0P7BS14_9BACT|nr:SAM-dependent methyltransferase [Jiulongibacter sediminis]KPM47194.1 SAM-dependent methyltransferase [Jiulongibacter sediminis]TBX22752.1 SAM-dependent methyltransferase [Jiulongibacter sediminis]